MRIRSCSLLFSVLATISLPAQDVRTVSGVVLDTAGRPVDAACVLAAARDSWLTSQVLSQPTTRTTKDGNFLCPLRADEYVVIAAPANTAILAYAGGSTSPGELGPFVLSKGHTLEGRVLDSDGLPLAGVTVAVQDWIGTSFPVTKTSRTQTDVRGEFAAACVPPRQLALVLSKDGFVTRRIGPVSVAAKVQERMTRCEPPALPGQGATTRREDAPVPQQVLPASNVESRTPPGESLVGRFEGRVGAGWHVWADNITERDASEPPANPTGMVPVAADGSFRIPRLSRGRHWVVAVIPSFDEIGEPNERWVTIVTVPQEGRELVVDAEEYRPGFVEGVVRLSKPDAWRRLVILAQELRPPPRGFGGGSWLTPEPRYGVLDAAGRFRLGLRPGYYEISVADPLTGVRLHTWPGAVQVRADDRIAREIDLTLAEVAVVIQPPNGTPAWFRGFTTGVNWRPCPEFWNDVLDQPRGTVALFGPSRTFYLRGYWHDPTGALHDVCEQVNFDSNDPRPIRVELKR